MPLQPMTKYVLSRLNAQTRRCIDATGSVMAPMSREAAQAIQGIIRRVHGKETPLRSEGPPWSIEIAIMGGFAEVGTQDHRSLYRDRKGRYCNVWHSGKTYDGPWFTDEVQDWERLAKPDYMKTHGIPDKVPAGEPAPLYSGSTPAMVQLNVRVTAETRTMVEDIRDRMTQQGKHDATLADAVQKAVSVVWAREDVELVGIDQG